MLSPAAKAVEVGYAPNWVQELIYSVPKGFISDPSEVGGYPQYLGTPYTTVIQTGCRTESLFDLGVQLEIVFL